MAQDMITSYAHYIVDPITPVIRCAICQKLIATYANLHNIKKIKLFKNKYYMNK